jgi:hypothetical protein
LYCLYHAPSDTARLSPDSIGHPYLVDLASEPPSKPPADRGRHLGSLGDMSDLHDPTVERRPPPSSVATIRGRRERNTVPERRVEAKRSFRLRTEL